MKHKENTCGVRTGLKKKKEIRANKTYYKQKEKCLRRTHWPKTQIYKQMIKNKNGQFPSGCVYLLVVAVCCLLATLFCAKIKLLLRFGPVGSALAWTGGVRSRLVLGTSVRFGMDRWVPVSFGSFRLLDAYGRTFQ